MIIVEGTDRVGKTTLCKKLLERLPTHIYSHSTKPPKDFDYYWGYIDRISPNVVQDRFHMGEVVYSRVRGVRSELGSEEYRLVDAALRQVGAFTVVITTLRQTLEKRLDGEDMTQQMYNKEQIIRANDLFSHMTYEGTELNSGFKPDVDRVFICNEGYPYVSEADIDGIVARYKARRLALSFVSARRRKEVV